MKQWGLMNQRTKQRTAKPRLTLALFAAVAAVTCAKAEDQALPGATGGGGSDGGGLTGGTGIGNTTTISTASAATATTAAGATTATSGASSGTSGGGTQGGEAGAPGDTSSTGSGGEGPGGTGDGNTGTGGTSTTGVPPDVIENAELVLLYKVDGAQASAASIFMHLYLRNQSDDAFPLNAAEVRYWLDSDGRNYTMVSHYQGPGIGDVTLTKGSDGDEEYVAVTFEAASLEGNTTDINRNEFQLKLDAAGGNFDQSNDFSFAPTLTSPTEHDRITVYLADELIWGCEPSGKCASDDPGAGGAAGAAGAEG